MREPRPKTRPPRKPPDWPPGAVFTVGHSTRPLGELIELLRTYGVECVADIRTVPRSRRNPQFNADQLGPALLAAGMDYEPMKGLGGLRNAVVHGELRMQPSANELQKFLRVLDRLLKSVARQPATRSPPEGREPRSTP